MGTAELFILAVGLSMDAFAVSVCKGLSLGKINWKHMRVAGAWFGGFQALMPFIGYLLGSDHKCVALDRICSSSPDRRRYDPGSTQRCGVRGCVDGYEVHVPACDCDKHRCTGSRRFVCLSQGRDRSGSLSDRDHHVCLFSGWSEDRKSVWCAVSIESRVVRRCDLDPDRSENAGRGAGEYLNIES